MEVCTMSVGRAPTRIWTLIVDHDDDVPTQTWSAGDNRRAFTTDWHTSRGLFFRLLQLQ